MKRPHQKFLAGAGFSGHKHSAVGWSNLVQQTEYIR